MWPRAALRGLPQARSEWLSPRAFTRAAARFLEKHGPNCLSLPFEYVNLTIASAAVTVIQLANFLARDLLLSCKGSLA
jgi:hypothetical protein